MLRFLQVSALAALGGLSFATAAQAPTDNITTEQLIARLTAAIDNIRTLRCTVKAQERVSGKLQLNQTAMKIAYAPYRVYLRNQKGIEVLWVKGQNNGDAWVYPNSFPYVTLNLDPNGSLMRRSQHHTALNAGFGAITDILRGGGHLRQDRSYERSFRYDGDTTIAGRACYLLRSDYPQFRYVSYKALRGDTPDRVADRFGCGEYRVLERNGLSPQETIAEGKVLQVPNAYGRRTIISVDQKLMLPLAVQVYDDKGLFEQFAFSDIVANQPIPEAEFTKTFKGYKF